ncbi:MAG: hypothetical protein M1814_006315 [Vezdaea aestivalis]|nr:MAG: hypothetical protein M1814_006315 [Vezdaea aestivalis]
MPPNDAKRHAACDECRSRKLRCSGEGSGCNRCRRDKMKCHYSLQKTMGRPRKHQNVQTGMSAPIEWEPEVPLQRSSYDTTQPAEVQWRDPLLYSYPDHGQSTYTFSGLSGSGSAGLSYDFHYDAPFDNIAAYGIDFDMGDPSELFYKAWTDTTELSRRLAAGGYGAVSAEGCDCIPKLFSMISQLETVFSQQIYYPQSLNNLQQAFKLAQENFFCSRCQQSTKLTFHSTMLLGTLIPLIIEGYRRCLDSVDHEVAYLDSKGLQKVVGSYGADSGYQIHSTLQHPPSQVTLSTDVYRERSRQTLRQDIIGTGNFPDPNSLLGLIRAYQRRANDRERRAAQGLEPSMPLNEQKWIRKPLCLVLVERSIEMIQGLGLGWSEEVDTAGMTVMNELLLPSSVTTTATAYPGIHVGLGVRRDPWLGATDPNMLR